MKLDRVQHDSYRDACFSLGLVEDDKEYIEGIIETSQWSSTNSLRNLFATLLSSDTLGLPEFVWDSCWPYLSDDILYNRRRDLQHPELVLRDDEVKNLALAEVEKILRRH
ncbi:helicase-like protein, partial [Striga asiatica]